MATRNPADVKGPLSECTEFVMHKSQQQIFAGIQRKIVDYTEHRLLRYMSNVKDPQQKQVLMAMIKDYRDGNIAVAWRRGQPVYVRVMKEGV
jgi:hypothetical protein